MRFTPKTREEIEAEEKARRNARLLPPGEYDAEVMMAKHHTGKSGNESIKLTWRVFNTDDTTVLIDDYLTASMDWKLRHFVDATGLADRYDTGELEPEDCIGVGCRVKTKIEKSEQYGDKAAIKDYVVPKEAAAPAPRRRAAAPAPVAAAEASGDDDIPF